MGSDQAVRVRRAAVGDQATIRRMVRAEHLDPTALHWSHFVVAEVDGAGTVGIGQIRPYPNGPELGSMVVLKPYRGRGIGGLIVRELLASTPPPVWLEAAAHNAPYYARFGFVEVPWQQAPMPLRLKAGMGSFLGRLVGIRLAVMRWDGVD
jgi:GNAT superfamily N-acetyltransferase